MENKKEYKLIDGVFSAEDADKVLVALFNYKIDYHNREDFSNHIRFNKDIEHSKKRITELIESKEAINKLLSESKANNFNLVINSTIAISIEK
jgi:hypothetical protein